MHALDSIRRRFDGFQRGRPWLAFPIAVWRKFSDAPTVSTFFPVPGAETVLAPDPELPAAKTINIS